MAVTVKEKNFLFINFTTGNSGGDEDKEINAIV